MLISVITPVYNGIQYIDACIQNVINQECSRMEHIIVDGGSNDGTTDIIKNYAERYPHIRWVSEKDRGQSDALNKGIQKACGEILSILNVDDYYEPGVLNRILDIFNGLAEPSLVIGNCNIWATESRLINVNKPKELSLENLLLGTGICEYPMNPSAYFYHKSVHKKIGYYDVLEHYALDLDFILRAVQVANIKYVDELWGNYRIVEGTKTFNDNDIGRSAYRREMMLGKYWKKLSFSQRLRVSINYMLRINYFSGIKHYANNKNEISVLITKLKRLISLS